MGEYSQNLIDDYNQKISVLEQRKSTLKSKLADLDSDYKTMQECKLKLAESSTLLNDLISQCENINKIFDRETIEGRYDSYETTFNSKTEIFDYLSDIVSSSNSFNTSCSEIKSLVDDYGTSLDNCCIEIAKDAEIVSTEIGSLEAQIGTFQLEVYNLQSSNYEPSS